MSTASYDIFGNFTQRTGVGPYETMPGGRVLSTGRDERFYYYDGNGDLERRSDGLQIDYTPFRRARAISSPDETIEYRYSASWRPVRRQSSTGGVTLLLGGLYERTIPPALGDHPVDHYLVRASGRTVARVERFIDLDVGLPCPPLLPCPPPAVTEEVVYVHDDQQGSTDVVSGAGGEVVQRVSFDAWGDPRDPDWAEDRPFDVELEVNRGYTGHTGALDAGLINMGGRLYDPVIARHTGPDPFVSIPTFSQSHNRYTYVLNNPLTHVDPTGYCVDSATCDNPGGAVGHGLFGLLMGLLQWGLQHDGGGGEQTGAQQHQNTRASSGGRNGGGRAEQVSTRRVTTDSVLLNAGAAVPDDREDVIRRPPGLHRRHPLDAEYFAM